MKVQSKDMLYQLNLLYVCGLYSLIPIQTVAYSSVCPLNDVFLCKQGAKGVPLPHGTKSALHVQYSSAEDAGNNGDDCQLVPMRMDHWCSTES